MSKYFIILLLILGQENTFCQTRNDSIIYWSCKRNLKWEDFQGKPHSDVVGEAAICCSGLSYHYHEEEDTIVSFVIKAEFLKYKSWTRTDSSWDLNHEQGHFDITEIFARKLRKSYLNIDPSLRSNSEEMHNKFLYYMKELKKFQNEYDAYTLHGLSRETQIEWSLKIKQMLTELKEFEIDDE